MKTEELNYEFQKNRYEKVRVRFSEYGGVPVLDIRVYFFHDQAREWMPGLKGITIRVDQIPALKEAIDKAYEIWARERTEREGEPDPGMGAAF